MDLCSRLYFSACRNFTASTEAVKLFACTKAFVGRRSFLHHCASALSQSRCLSVDLPLCVTGHMGPKW